MKQVQLSLENLKLLDFGVLNEVFAREVQSVVKDCADRPLEKTPRSVNMVFVFKPLVDRTGGTGDLEKVEVACDVVTKVPKKKTKVYTMTPKHDGTLVFHPDLPDEPDGSTLYDDEDKGKKK